MELSCSGCEQRTASFHFSQRTRETGRPAIRLYGVTDIVKMLLVMLPMVALIFTLPGVVTVVALWITPADTVAKVLSLVFQVATLVTSKSPLHVTAFAITVSVKLLPVNG